MPSFQIYSINGTLMWSGNYPTKAAMVQDALNAKQNLAGANFSGMDLTGVTFGSSASIAGANFNSATLKNASFSNLSLASCDFTKADMRGATMTGITSFAGAKMNTSALNSVASGAGATTFPQAQMTAAQACTQFTTPNQPTDYAPQTTSTTLSAASVPAKEVD